MPKFLLFILPASKSANHGECGGMNYNKFLVARSEQSNGQQTCPRTGWFHTKSDKLFQSGSNSVYSAAIFGIHPVRFFCRDRLRDAECRFPKLKRRRGDFGLRSGVGVAVEFPLMT
jgi:hypothetical protein